MPDSHDTAGEVARRSYGKLVAYLAARSHDVAAAEDALSEAFAAALTDWPRNGCPANPEGWLLTVARRKMIDASRRERPIELPPLPTESEIPDHRLALMFVCAHPAIEPALRAPLILQTILGLDARTIASAFLTSPAAMAKRLVRAKEKIRHAGIPFRIPDREDLPARLQAVLDAIYAAYTDAWTNPASTADEALFLASLVAQLLPDAPEALGLLALLLHTEARRAARRNAAGAYVPLAQQDPALWNNEMIGHAEMLLHRAGKANAIGRFQLEAAIQSAHVHRCRTGIANWEHVLRLYEALPPSPVVAVNRAIAIAEIHGPSRALESLAAIDDPRMNEYQPYWAARAELLARAGLRQEAVAAYGIAIGLEHDPAVRCFLQSRLTSTTGPQSGESGDRT